MDQKPKTIAEIFQQVWSQALVAVTGAEEEATKLMGRVQGAAGWSQEELKRQVREFTERLQGQRRELEGQVEATVKASLGKLRVPRRDEVAQLRARVDGLTKRAETLTQ